ncbi:hypothetical protein SUN_1538 [Calderihabitans maritimus]|uniref:DUF2304 domain-containing protein n=1 Tax=Calderihabitans maritimus TaxID=1246530 RepID=A0A1Z5HVI1_9FIRM|nr:hypothetical protein SUN_1538 [Calderihabitans maritimus]
MLAAAIGLSLGIFIFRLVLKRRLEEKYFLLWFGSGAVIFLLALLPGILDRAARALGVSYPPSVLFFFANLFMLIMLLFLSVQVSDLQEKNKELAQHVALLRFELEEIKGKKRGKAE